MTSEHMIDVQFSERLSMLLVQLSGELDIATAPQLQAKLGDAPLTGLRRVIFDLERVRFIDSSGLGALVSFRKEHPETETVLVSPDSSVVARVLELTSMKDLFPIHASTEEAFDGT